MKPRTLFLLLLLLNLSPCYAQTRIGFKAGANYAYLRHVLKDSDEQKTLRKAVNPKLGYTLGVAADYKLSKAFSLQSGLNWTNKGERYSDKGKDMSVEYEYRERTSVNFIEIPVQAAFTFKGIQVFGGPYFGVGITGSKKTWFEGLVNGVRESNEDKLNIKFRQTLPADFKPQDGNLYMRRFDYGVNAGLGYQTGSTLVAVSYAWGLANTRTHFKGSPTYGENKSFYCVPSLSATYFLR